MASQNDSSQGLPAAWRRLPEPVVVGTGRLAVRLTPVAQGRDLVVLITGGEAHVGAVAVEAAAGPLGPAARNLYVVPGHREGHLAADCARELAAAVPGSCLVVAGIHQDDATRQEIDGIVANVREGTRRLAAALRREGDQS